jgi:tubulin delta
MQREAEKCDNLEGFVILMSVAGGTGSGLGTYVTNMLREEYPTANIINPIVWPYDTGEVIVQNYNALLTTSELYNSSDALILLLNDHLHKICSKLLLLKDISFTDLNKVASHILASVLQPAVPYETIQFTKDYGFLNQFCSLSDLCTSLTPQPDYRLLSIKCVPQMPNVSQAFTHYLWVGLLKYLRQMLLTDSPTDEGMDWTRYKVNKCLANLLIFRGQELHDLDVTSFSHNEACYVDWVPPFMRQSVWCSPFDFNHYEKSCSVVSNSQSCINPVNSITDKAWKMYSARAYVHQYSQFGLSDNHFMECFVKVEQVLKNYKNLT